MHHLPVHPERLRIAVITFAMDTEIIIDGISNSNRMTKCDIFNDEDNYHWNDIIYKVQYDLSDGINKLDHSLDKYAKVDEALTAARQILTIGKFSFETGVVFGLLFAFSLSHRLAGETVLP